MGAEIREIIVRGRHSDRLTQCYPCQLGHSEPGSAKCELCPANHFFYVNEDTSEFYCKKCDAGYFSPVGSVGEVSCKKRRPCD